MPFGQDIHVHENENLPTNRICTCGHTLTIHAFTQHGTGIVGDTTTVLVTGACIYSDECDCTGFRWSGKVEENE